MTDATSAPIPEKASLLEDFIDIFGAPSKVFARREKSGFFLVMMIVTLLIGGLGLANRGVVQGIADAEFRRQTAKAMEANPAVTEESMAASRKIMDVATSYGAFVFVPIAILVVGLVTFLTGKIFGAQVGYQSATMITSYAFIPKVLASLAVTIQGAVMDTSAMSGMFSLSVGVGRFLDPDMSPGLLGLLGRVDVFTIWGTILLAIGLSVVGKIPREKAMLAGVVIWSIGAIPALIQLAMS